MQSEYQDYLELENIGGTKNYQVEKIYSKDFEIPEIYLDTVAKNINIYGKTNPLQKEDAEHHRRKVDFLGKVLDEGPIYTVLKDGTLCITANIIIG